jgi:5-methylcytosine-specific restriction enzyme B
MSLLTDDDIRGSWKDSATFEKSQNWIKEYLESINKIRELSDERLKSPEGQRVLWAQKGPSGLGPGEAVVLPDKAFQDAEIASSLVALRSSTWPEDARARATALASEYDRILNVLAERHTKKRPQSKLLRVFSVLLPGEVHCGFNRASQRGLAELLLNDSEQRLRPLEQHVLVRARLRKVLGPERELEEHVRRSIFCWRLYKKHNPSGAGEVAPQPADEGESKGKIQQLTVYPFSKQLKGNFPVSRMTAAYRDVIQACLPGVPPKELLDVLGDNPDFKSLSKASQKQLTSRLVALGLLTRTADGLLRPTPEGENLLEEETPDVLVARFIERVFPFAALLAYMTKPRTMKELKEHLRELYPNWTEDRGPSGVIAWARDLELIEKDEAEHFALSEYGRYFAERLPEALPKAPEIAKESVEDLPAAQDAAHQELRIAALEALLQRFKSEASKSGLVISEEHIEDLHHALHSQGRKRFVILSGLSGTGKTRIIHEYALMNCLLLNLDPEKHVSLVAVSPDWQDHTGLLGYVNALHEEPTYQREEALLLVLKAASDPANPYFLILDEMNLARVERYFAPFLSAMETGGALRLHGAEEPVDGVPPSVPWPANLYIAGTVNMDETTFAFSDKVLDRAFTFEFWEVDLKAFFEQSRVRDSRVEQVLLSLYALLRPVRRHFGYRTAKEVLEFVSQAGTNAAIERRNRLLDRAVFSKVLPRIRGENAKPFKEALEGLHTYCQKEQLVQSASKLKEMSEMLQHTGITRFWA